MSNDKNDKKQRTAIYEDVSRICEELEGVLEVKFEEDARQLFGEVVWKKLQLYGRDLESFHKHAKRTVVNVDDVKLLVRNNDDLKAIVEEKCKGFVKAETATRGRKRKSEKD